MQMQITSTLTNATLSIAVLVTMAFLGLFTTSFAKGDEPEPIAVKVVKSAEGWILNRGGKPYRVEGAGGPASLELLAQCGANSTRTWGLDQLVDGKLDDAHRNGLTVTVGIWLRHDLDYSDPQQVDEQIQRAMDGVKKYKNHPAVLAWGVGNEMEGPLGDNPDVWRHVERIAKLIKQEDPLHPTMTVLAEIGGEKVKQLHQHCPSIDIVGVNSYGGAPSFPKRYREAGGTKPYLVTEFGPRGPWEFPKNEVGSVNEELGHVKAATYLESHKSISADRELCLGSYAFMWGYKQEATPTWFGMFLADGRKTPAVDVMIQQWTGKPAKNLCPRIDALTLEGGTTVNPGSTLNVTLQVRDPEQQTLNVDWVLMEDAKEHLTSGYFQETPPSFKENVLKTSNNGAKFRAPAKPGLYRIFAYVGDGNNAADVANIVFRVQP